MSEANVPPWLQQELERYDQLQQTLQALLVQKQQVDLELTDIEKAIEELTKESDDVQVYKIAGSIMIRTTKQELLKELGERKELANTRRTILTKQEEKIRQSLQEIQAKVNQAIKGPSTA